MSISNWLVKSVALLSWLVAPAVLAQTDLSLSPDITIDLDGTITADEAVGLAPHPGATSLTNLGPLPESADVIAYHRQSPTESLFALDTTVSLGGNVYAPGDVISWNGSTHSLAFDAVSAGLPSGLTADAVGRDPLGNILLSFDQTADLGSGVIVGDEDVVRFVGVTPSIAFDGSEAGLADALDVDGLHELGGGRFALSFDTGGMIGGVAFADEDLLYVDPSAGAWYLLVDGSELDADLVPANVDGFAVPEPGMGASLAFGGALMGWLGRRRRQRAGRFAASIWGARARLNSSIASPSLLVLLLAAFAAEAGDGVLEINQTCAIETGCFAGDTPGFPITIATGGSYRLTSNLDLSGEPPSISAAAGSAPGIHLDLGGFEIRGPTTCTGSGPTIACSPGPLGTGGISFSIAAVGPSVSNGTVRGFARAGVVSEAIGLRVEGLTVVHNFDDGIAAAPGAVVRGSISIENGQDGVEVDGGRVEDVMAIGNGGFGIEVDGPGGLARASTATGNGSSGFELVSLSKYGTDNASHGNGAADSCGGRFCSEKKRFYTDGSFEFGTSPPPDFCDDGFRLMKPLDLVSGHLVAYDGGGASATLVNLGGRRYGVSEGGTAGHNGFRCDDEPGGIRCSPEQALQLTSGWQVLQPPPATTLNSTLCIED